MYRTARIHLYDVLDTVFVNLVLTEYDGLPGEVTPTETVWSTTAPGIGAEDYWQWLLPAIGALVTEIERP